MKPSFSYASPLADKCFQMEAVRISTGFGSRIDCSLGWKREGSSKQKPSLNGFEGPMHAFEEITVYYPGTFHYVRCSWSSEVR